MIFFLIIIYHEQSHILHTSSFYSYPLLHLILHLKSLKLQFAQIPLLIFHQAKYHLMELLFFFLLLILTFSLSLPQLQLTTFLFILLIFSFIKLIHPLFLLPQHFSFFIILTHPIQSHLDVNNHQLLLIFILFQILFYFNNFIIIIIIIIIIMIQFQIYYQKGLHLLLIISLYIQRIVFNLNAQIRLMFYYQAFYFFIFIIFCKFQIIFNFY